MKLKNLKFNKQGLIPAIIQDKKTNEVLMMAYMNKESLKKTLLTGNTWFYSRSRQKLWQKGETSGNIQLVKDIKYDCDNDTLLILVEVKGPACHTGEKTCFHRKLKNDVKKAEEIKEADLAANPPIIQQLVEVIKERKKKMPEGSYTTKLFKEGMPKIVAKVSEECTEVIEAAMTQGKKEIIWETADLFYHLLVMLAKKNIDFIEVEEELRKRRSKTS